MAEVIIGSFGQVLNAAQTIAALDGKLGADLARQGAGKLYLVRDTLTFRCSVDLSGCTFICFNNKTVRFVGTSAQPAKITAGKVVGGKYTDGLNIIYENSTGMGEHDFNLNAHGMFLNAEADIKQLYIESNKNDANYFGLTFASSKKVKIDELIVNNKNLLGRLYVNINLTHVESQINFHTLRGATLRVPNGKFGFLATGQGWYRGEDGNQIIKLLTKTGSKIKGFSPIFDNNNGSIQMSSDTISGGSTTTFLDSFLSDPNNQITVYPPNNDNVVRYIARTLNVNLTESNGTQINDSKIIIESNRTIFGNAGVTPGKTDLINKQFNFGDSEEIIVWKGWNTSGAGTYKKTGKRIDDSNLTLYITNFDYKFLKVIISGHRDKILLNNNLIKDTLVVLTKLQVSALNNIKNVTEAYCTLKNYLTTNNRKITEMPITYNLDKLYCKNLNVTFDANAEKLVSLTGNNLIFKSSSFTGSVETTGTVTGKELVSGTVIDATQDSAIVIKGIVSWEEINTETTGTGTFSFKYTEGVSYKFKVTLASGLVLEMPPITPTEAGVIERDLGQQATLLDMQKNMKELAKQKTVESAQFHAQKANEQTQK